MVGRLRVCNFNLLLGFTDSIKWNKKNLYYQVETLIFGEAVNRALKPEQFIIGTTDNKINKKYLKFLKSYKSKIHIMNYKSAELAKISINLYLFVELIKFFAKSLLDPIINTFSFIY